MNKILSRTKIFALILTLVLSFNFLPLAVWAEKDENLAVPDEINDEAEAQADQEGEDIDNVSINFIESLENEEADDDPDLSSQEPADEEALDLDSSNQGIVDLKTEEENVAPLLLPEPSTLTGIKNQRTKQEYTHDQLLQAVEDAETGDTLELGEAHYSLYGEKLDGKDSNAFTAGKDLTFVGKGSDKTFWGIGAETPDPSKFGTEHNGDYSFDGAGTITFKGMTLQSASADYLGFIRADHTVVEDCVINGKTFYWGYTKATFTNTTFNAPDGDYAIWTYSSPIMTFDGCIFNSNLKTINVYTDAADKHDITVNFKDCTVNSKAPTSVEKPVLNINDSNMGNYTYNINISGTNVINGNVARDTKVPNKENYTATCSRWFGFGGKQDDNNTGRTVVTIDGETVFKDGKMISHEIDTTNDKYTDGYKDNAYTVSEWALDLTANQYIRTKTCDYCKQKVEEKGYQILYNPAGGVWSDNTSDPKSSDITPIKTVQSLIDAPTRTGYNFIGWKLDGTDKRYPAGATYDVTNAAGEYIYSAFEAVWEPEPVDIPEIVLPGPTVPQSITVYTPAVVKQIKGGQPAMPDSFTFRLEAVSFRPQADQQTEVMPLPLDNRAQDGSAALLQIQGAGSGSFGQITYNKPGDYTYKITEVANPSLPYNFANTVYTFTDHVYEKDGKLMNDRTLLRDGQPVNSITAYFTNEYTDHNSIHNQVQNLPATGAIDSLTFGVCLSAIGLAILLGLKKHS